MFLEDFKGPLLSGAMCPLLLWKPWPLSSGGRCPLPLGIMSTLVSETLDGGMTANVRDSSSVRAQGQEAMQLTREFTGASRRA